MLLEPENAAATLDRDGETLYFCSRGCRNEFQEAPARAAAVGDLPAG